MSWDDFLEAFKKRHAADYAGERQATPQTVAHSPSHSPTKLVNGPQIKPQVAKEAVVAEDWDAVEEVEVEQDEYWR